MTDLINLFNDCLVTLQQWFNIIVGCGVCSCSGVVGLIALIVGLIFLRRRASSDRDAETEEVAASQPVTDDTTGESHTARAHARVMERIVPATPRIHDPAASRASTPDHDLIPTDQGPPPVVRRTLPTGGRPHFGGWDDDEKDN